MSREANRGGVRGVASVVLLSLCGLVVLSNAEAGRARVAQQIHPGHYSGGGFPSTPVDFGVSANRRKVKHFHTRFKMDCKQDGQFVGELTITRFVISSIPIQQTARGGTFIRTAHVHFSQGGRLRVRIRGDLIAPERAKGVIRPRARLPGGLVCKPFFGPINWTARFLG
jgi:hypothetical protein